MHEPGTDLLPHAVLPGRLTTVRGRGHENDTKSFYLRTKESDAAFRRKNNCTIYSDKAGVRWWFKYRDEPAFELPPNIIDKYHNNVLSIRDVMEYWVKHRE